MSDKAAASSATASLKDAVVAVTGGAAGIGLQITRRFLRDGAHVFIGDLQEPPEDVGCDPRVSFLRTDVAREEDVAALVASAVDSHGQLDVMVNNAGYGGTLSDVTELDMAKVDVNVAVLLKGPLHGYKHAGAVMKAQRSGCILSIASVAGLIGGGAPVVYSVCKAAVIHLAKCAAIELAPYNVRSNAVCPGFIATQLGARAFGLGKDEAEAFAEHLRALASEGRGVPKLGVPDDVAETIAFLASPAARFITGQAIAVDGGYGVNPAHDLGQAEIMRAAIASWRDSLG